MKNLNKILSIILAILMAISIIPITASAETPTSGTCGENLTWSFDESTGTLTISGTGAMDDFEFSFGSFYDGNRPWEIFRYYVKHIVINDNVTSIGEYAFTACENLIDIVIGENVSSVNVNAFENCFNFADITVDSDNSYFSNDEFGVLFNKEKNELICYPTGNNRTSYTVPAGVTIIGDYAFFNADHLVDVIIGSGATTIDCYAFSSCELLSSITIPKTVTAINKGAFDESYYIRDVDYAGLEEDWNKITIGLDNETLLNADIHFDFSNDEIKTGTCGETLTWFFDAQTRVLTISGIGAMDNCTGEAGVENCPWEDVKYRIQKIVIDEGATTIGNGMFFNCYNVLDVVIPNSITSIGNDVFSNCISLTSVEIPVNVTTIGFAAFSDCIRLTSVIIPKNVTMLGEAVFANCMNLESVVIYGDITKIESSTFAECTNLKEITIPASVTTFMWYAIDTNNNIENVYYGGTEEQWQKIVFEGIISIFHPLRYATIHYNSTGPHTHNYETVVTQATCTEQGYTTYTCECGDSYVDDYVNATGHSHTSEVTTPATHTETGIMTYTCVCGDTYTEAIEKLEKHNYEIVVTVPTCTEQGYRTYTCECGDSYVDDYVDATGHNYSSEITIPATHTKTGVMTYTCTCGDSYTEVIEKLEKHNYESVVTEPTCTEQGYTTYTCECGDSYVANYVDALGHTEETIPAVAPSCTETGLTEGVKCSVCDETLTAQKELSPNGHTPATAVEENYIAPTCTEQGSKDIVVYCSVCDEEISRETETIEATGHADNDGDGYCDECDEELGFIVLCDHNCHKGGISGFFWKISNFFNRIFGLKKYCECGAAHY